MNQIEITKIIKAPVERVFETIADIHNFSKAVSDIVHVEILSDITSGVGTRFRETRLINGKEATTELEVTEYIENNRIRIVADSHGTVWDSIFIVQPSGELTELKLVMTANPYKFLPRVLNPLMKGFIKKALKKDLVAVKAYCER